LLDDSRHPRQQIRVDVDANLFRRLEINHQLDLHRLFGEEISGLGELATGFQRNAEQ
jgi:hypothetical protein